MGFRTLTKKAVISDKQLSPVTVVTAKVDFYLLFVSAIERVRAMKNCRRMFVMLCALGLFAWGSSPCLAQTQEREIKRTWGVSTYLQTAPVNIVIPIWLTPRFVLAPLLTVNYLENSATTIGGGVALRIYPVMQRVAPYWGVRAQAINTNPSGPGSGATAYAGSLYFGGEFFLNPKFSLGVEPGLNITLPPNSGPIAVTTATVMVATVHF